MVQFARAIGRAFSVRTKGSSQWWRWVLYNRL
jgi:hypothetical protein